MKKSVNRQQFRNKQANPEELMVRKRIQRTSRKWLNFTGASVNADRRIQNTMAFVKIALNV